MSIADELKRIQGAKAAIKAALEAHYVNVPSDATIDNYADLVTIIGTSEGRITIDPEMYSITIDEDVEYLYVEFECGYEDLGVESDEIELPDTEESILSGCVLFVIDGNIYSYANCLAGQARCTIFYDGIEPGEHDMYVVFLGDRKYNPAIFGPAQFTSYATGTPTFGGLEIAQGPLCYVNGKYTILGN